MCRIGDGVFVTETHKNDNNQIEQITKHYNFLYSILKLNGNEWK